MKLAFLFVFFPIWALAAAVQVPESCVGRVLPCLVRTEQTGFNFVQGNVEVKLAGDTLVKLSGSDAQVNFEVLSGYIGIVEKENSKRIISLNGVPVDSESIMASRLGSKIEILSLDNFSYEEFKISDEKFPVRVKGEFINKKDLVFFTRHFFTESVSYRRFLEKIEKEWSSEFKRQNISQTKALLRSIASEQKREKELAEKKMRDEQEAKKIKERFFYRTFYR